ncbi:hypothetical protein AA313_de0203092 [Arthrobotrys entomopaga]|nr:hypothetical protein AA313_de0203092 [Arthrobotrys entomopaga]
MKNLLGLTFVFISDTVFIQAGLILPPPFGDKTPHLAHGYGYGLTNSDLVGPVTDVSTANAPGTHTRQMDYLTAQCQMGMWDHGFDNKLIDGGRNTHSNGDDDGHYQGYFIEEYGANTCVDLKTLHPNLPNTVSSYRVTGYCECDFYDNPGCQDFRFSAFNREDEDLGRNGPDNDNLESVRCRKTNHADQFQTCDLDFIGSGGSFLVHDRLDTNDPTDWSSTDGISSCRVFPSDAPPIATMLGTLGYYLYGENW